VQLMKESSAAPWPSVPAAARCRCLILFLSSFATCVGPPFGDVPLHFELRFCRLNTDRHAVDNQARSNSASHSIFINRNQSMVP